VTVELLLPLASSQPAQAELVVAPVLRETQSAVILIVDDEPLIAMNTCDMLEDLGHTVVQASSGTEALEILGRDQRIAAMVTDHAMPGMTGLELARRAQAVRPGLPVLLATGYADLPPGEAAELPRLGKPYGQAQLAVEIAQLLG
jgi:CheY-like chemotaxis protein